ncbi:outer membrane protein OmpK [Thaumasiovibrio sp. DFM-14]|uniref:nucleoside-specific channel-forming Tsx family protein n=1 Tax=Thaumasiovibrio sp. DFM-14 TaxID=3384792 RepID=UPI0039A2F61C
MRKTLLAMSIFAATAAPVIAADYSDDIHKNDYKWMQFNLMYAFDELPGESSHDYMEMEFGGRSGIFDLYGYVDVFNLTSDSSSDKANADAKMFMKFAPRMSIDALTKKDLSFGPVQELYVASEITWDGVNGRNLGEDSDGNQIGTFGVNQQKIGLGSDVMVPWLGKIGLNLYGNYDSNVKDWNGYQISTNWFKPVHFFDNGSFVAYQGYIDFQFGMKDEYASSSNGGVMFNGLYWHSDRYSVGYGLKAYKDVYGIKDTDAFKSTGFAHYIAATYKF